MARDASGGARACGGARPSGGTRPSGGARPSASDPDEITWLRREIACARGAFDDGDLMTTAHRRRVVGSVESCLADAASAAARAGHGRRALALLVDAAEPPARWLESGAGWVETVDVATQAVLVWVAPDGGLCDDALVVAARR